MVNPCGSAKTGPQNKRNMKMEKNITEQETVGTQKEEIFVPIKGYEGLYSVSNMGRIKSEKKNIFKKSKIDKHGRLCIHLCNNGIKKDFFIHRLVAEHFVEGQTEEKNCVCHINGIKTDNRASNLKWRNSYANFLEIEKKLPMEDSPKTVLTNIQLARWLACGNGLLLDEFDIITTCYIYMNKNGSMDNKPCRNVLVRKWGDTDWHKPTHEYCYGKTATEGVIS